MIIFFYGNDSYRILQAVKLMVERYQKKYPESFNLHRFDLEEDDFNEVENAIKGTSFFKQVKFIIVKNPFSKLAALEKFLKDKALLEDKNNVLLLYQAQAEESMAKNNPKFFNLLKGAAQTKEFVPLSKPLARKFALNYLSRQKFSIKKEALDKLIGETESDSWRMKNELDKLIGFLKTEGRKTIERQDLEKLLNFKIDYNIFNLVDAVFTDKARAVSIFEDFLSTDGDPLRFISLASYQLKNMLAVRDLLDKNFQYGQILKKTGLHPYLFKKVYEATRKYTLEELKEIFQKLADAEIALKTGRTEPQNVLLKILL